MNREHPRCMKCKHRHDTALTCQQAKETAAHMASPRVQLSPGYCNACEVDHGGFTCHDFQTMKAKALREQAARESQGDARVTHYMGKGEGEPFSIGNVDYVPEDEPQAAAPQDGTKVQGYRKLSDAEIEQMNIFKAISRHMVHEIDTQIANIKARMNGPAMQSVQQREEDSTALRWLSIARTHQQEATMAACRAIARPENDC